MQSEIHSALRALVRAQRITFQGDIRARQAARDLNRGLLGPAISSSTTQEEKVEAIQSAKQVARYLVENVLQGVPKSESEAAYQLRFTPYTALGDNESIKSVSPAPSLDEIKSTMNQGDQPKNTRKRRQRNKDASASPSSNEGSTACGNAPSSP